MKSTNIARPGALLLCAVLLAGCASQPVGTPARSAASTPATTSHAPSAPAPDVSREADAFVWPPDYARLPANLNARTEPPPAPVLLRGATVMTAAGAVYEGGDLLLEGGRIARVSAAPIDVGSDVTVVDARGKYVTPGLIDAHSHLGVFAHPGVEGHGDVNEATDPITGDASALYAIWPQDPGFERALRGGVTTMQILPGSANIVGGRGLTVSPRRAASAREMLFEGAPTGVKMACGENPKRVYGDRNAKPRTRMGTAAILRANLQRARELQATYARYERNLRRWRSRPNPSPDDRPDPPARNLSLETLVGVLEGTLLVHVHCYRADEIVQILQIADEYGFAVRSFHHATDAYKVRDLLASRDVGVATWSDWWGFKMEAYDAIPEALALLQTAGVRAIVHSDSPTGIQVLNQDAARAYHAGLQAGLTLSEDEALRWITANAAWALGIDAHTGTLEEGKRADVVVWSAHPFSVYARAEQVYIEGHLEFDLAANPAPPRSDFELGQHPDVPEGRADTDEKEAQ